jgi:hypothetical protein
MLSTKNIGNDSKSSVPKTLAPGNAIFKVNTVQLDAVPYKVGAYNLILNIEGPDMGSDFEGFLIDKDDPTKGRYAGQVGKLRFNEYPYADAVTPKGDQIFRDDSIMTALKNLAKAFGSDTWLDLQDGKHETIESLVEQFNADQIFAGQYLRACIAGREYQNKSGYTNYDLYLPKWSRQGNAYENANVDEAMSKVVKFSEEVHIKKNKAAETKSFGDGVPTTSGVANDFQL